MALHRKRAGLTQQQLSEMVVCSAGAYPTMQSMTTIMSFDDHPDLAYLVEGVQTGSLKDDPAQVERCWMSYDLARAAALSPTASLALTDSVAEAYEREHGS